MKKILDDCYLEEWLAQENPEEVLDPELPIVDLTIIFGIFAK